MKRIILNCTHLFPWRYYSLKRVWKPDTGRIRNFLSFGDAIECLRRELDLDGKVILLPSFYCEYTVALFRRFMSVRFYCMNWDSLDADVASFRQALVQFNPQVALINNVFGKESVLLKDTSWLSSLPADTVVISDCAHSLLPLCETTPLNGRHFFIDSARKCTPYMFSQCLYPDRTFHRSCRPSIFSWYSFFSRALFQTKQCLAGLYLITGLKRLLEWSENVFWFHNGIIGLSGTPHAAWLFDSICYSFVRFDEVARSRVKLWHAYSSELLRTPPSSVGTWNFGDKEASQMCFFPIRVPREQVEKLVNHCWRHGVQAERLWHLEKTAGLPQSEVDKGAEIVVVPLTPAMAIQDVKHIVSTIVSFGQDHRR